MKREDFLRQMEKSGDAIVSYISPVSKKLKFNVATTCLDTRYIKAKEKLRTFDPERVTIFCWDTDGFKQIDPNSVVKVEPMSQEIERKRYYGRRTTTTSDRHSSVRG